MDREKLFIVTHKFHKISQMSIQKSHLCFSVKKMDCGWWNISASTDPKSRENVVESGRLKKSLNQLRQNNLVRHPIWFVGGPWRTTRGHLSLCFMAISHAQCRGIDIQTPLKITWWKNIYLYVPLGFVRFYKSQTADCCKIDVRTTIV